MSLSRLTQLILIFISVLALLSIWTGGIWQLLWRVALVCLIVLIVIEKLSLTNAYAIKRCLQTAPLLGERCTYQLTLINQTSKVLVLESQSAYPETLEGEQTIQSWRIASHSEESRCFDYMPVRLGKTELGVLYLKQLGRWGLCWWTRQVNEPLEFCVQPARLKQLPIINGTSGQGQHKRCLPNASGGELLDLREFHYGDSLKSVDWKATARRGKPIVRRFEREQRLEIVLLIDCGRAGRSYIGGMDRLHHYVNVAAKLAEFATLQGDHIACLAYTHEVLQTTAMASGFNGLQRIRNLLSQLSVGNETSNPLPAALAVKQLLRHRGFIVFLTELEQPEADAQLLKAGQLLASKHQILVATLAEPELETLITHPQDTWLYPYQQFAALEYLQGREASRQHLLRLGLSVIATQPDDLAHQVLTYYQHRRAFI